jgi:hypothetical protein
MIVPGTRPLFKPRVGAQLDRSHSTARGLQNLWLFNENSGNICYDYIGGADFVLSGGTTRMALADGPAVKFDGATGQALSPASPLSGAAQFTIILLCKNPVSGGNAFLFGGNTAYNGSIFAYFDSGGGFSLFIGGAKVFSRVNPLVSGTYNQIALSFDGTGGSNQTKYYNDGVLAGTVASGVASIAMHTGFILGRDGSGGTAGNTTASALKIYNRILSTPEINDDFNAPWTMFTMSNQRKFYSVGGAGVVILPVGIASSEVLGLPVMVAGGVAISPSGIGTLEAFGFPVVVPGAVAILPSGILSGEAFGLAAMLAGAMTISPGGIVSAESFGLPVMIPGPVSIAPLGATSSEAFGAASVVPGGVLIVPPGIISAEALGLPAIFNGRTLVIKLPTSAHLANSGKTTVVIN